MTNKRKICVLIPVFIISGFLIYSWTNFILRIYNPQFPHYIGLLLFIPILYFLFKDRNYKKVTIATGIYLLFGLINLLSFTTAINTSSFGVKIGSTTIFSPALNGLSLLILVAYGILNFDNLLDMHLDYKEARGKL